MQTDNAAEHLRRALAVLESEYRDVSSKLERLSRSMDTIRELLGESASTPGRRGPTASDVSQDVGSLGGAPLVADQSAPPVREIIEFFVEQGKVFTFDDVMRRVSEFGSTARRESVSSVISRDPRIENAGRRGVYRPVVESPEDSSSSERVSDATEDLEEVDEMSRGKASGDQRSTGGLAADLTDARRAARPADR